MGHGRGKSAGTSPPPPPPVADYNVTGEISPDATCNYFEAGTFNGQPYYRRLDNAWFIWYEDFWWTISSEVGVETAAFWRGVPFAGVEGIYYPLGTASGNATVSAGPH